MKHKLLQKGMIFGSVALLMGLPFISAIPSYQATSYSQIEDQLFTDMQNDNSICVPSYLQIGDLLFMDTQDDNSIWARPGFHNDHVAIYIGNNTFVNAIQPKVQIRDLNFFHSWAKNFIYAYVKSASPLQKQLAVDFALNQLDAGYQIFFDPPWFGLKISNLTNSHPTANIWYCMELAWASYYHQGIDIDKNKWAFPRWITGNDILGDDDIAFYSRPDIAFYSRPLFLVRDNILNGMHFNFLWFISLY